jgi:hypothetical protein
MTPSAGFLGANASRRIMRLSDGLSADAVVAKLGVAVDWHERDYPEAARRIIEAERTGATVLDLTGLQLRALPPSIGGLVQRRVDPSGVHAVLSGLPS